MRRVAKNRTSHASSISESDSGAPAGPADQATLDLFAASDAAETSGATLNGHGIGQRGATQHVGSHLAPAKVTEVYDSYWRFAAERQRVFFRRLANQPHPWTDDPVIGVYKFTNAYRASDRVSQYLIRKVIYPDDLPKTGTEVLFRILLFRLFNKIETWELLERGVRRGDLRGLPLR